MAQEIDLQIRFMAEDMYVEDRLTYQEIADRLNVALNTVKRWSKEGDWRTKRAEYLKKRRSLKEKLTKLRDTMLDKAVQNEDPQQAYAALRILKMEQDRKGKAEDKAPDIDRPKIFMENLEFIAATLKEIDPEGLKILARNFDALIIKFKAEYAQTT